MSGNGRRYPAEYRRRMIEMARSGKTAEGLLREHEPSAQAIRNRMVGEGRRVSRTDRWKEEIGAVQAMSRRTCGPPRGSTSS